MNRLLINSDKILSTVLSILVFVLIVDPTNTIFSLKNVVFLFLVILSALHFKRIKTYALIILLTVYLIIVISFIFGNFALYKFNFGYSINVIKGFSPLVLLFWIDKYRIINKMIFPSLVICSVVIFTFLAFQYNSALADVLYTFYMSHDATMMIGRRSFLGVKIIAFFYKTLPVLIIPFSLYSYRFFCTDGPKRKNFIIMLIILLTLFLGGTRASMLAGTLIFAIYFTLWLSKSNFGKLLIIPIFTAAIIGFSILFLSLILEKNEGSNKVKFADLNSYSDLIFKHPSILVVGQGPGSTFYSQGRKIMVPLTEWSYLEILRMFGVFGAIVIISLFFFPLLLIYRKRGKLKYWIPMFIGYLIYLIVGGTNPLLLGSTGMLVLLAAYSYSINPYYEINEW